MSEDPAIGKVVSEPVVATIKDPISPLIAVHLSNSSTITVTADHPFWVDGGPGIQVPAWIQAGQLQAGDQLRTTDDRDATVGRIQRNVGRAVVYTLTIADNHTYFVGAGQVLVHNCPVPGQTSGGVYVLRDQSTNAVVRTGRSKNLVRRGIEHRRDKTFANYSFQAVYTTDNYAELRGLEDLLYRQNPNAALNKIRAISPTNPRISLYRAAARNFMARLGLPYLEP